jgi:hypothetical protein
LPQGIRLVEKSFPFASLTVDSPAVCREGVLRFKGFPFAITVREAEIWDGRLSIAAMDMQNPSTERAWSIVWRTLNQQQRLKQTDLVAADLIQTDTGSLLTRRLSQPVQMLVDATEHLDAHAAAEAAGKMIGLGPGVTPSGDDLLLGYLAGLRSTAGQEEKPLAFVSDFGELLSMLTKETNEISRTYLHYAVRGEFSSSVLALLNAIADGQEQRLLFTATEAMRVGHSSGMDSVTGLLIGMRAWDGKLRTESMIGRDQ